MISHDDLEVIFERIVNHQETQSDRQTLRSLLRAGNGDNEIQIGKHIVNIAEGRDIHIGDRIYHNTDAEAIREALREVMSEGIVKTQTQQDILKDIFAGRDLTTGDIEQQNIKNQINLILNISDSGAISKAFSAIKLPDGWSDWRDKPKDMDDAIAQLVEIPDLNPDNSPLLNFIYLLTQDKSIPQIKRKKLGQLLPNQSFETNGKTTSTQPLHSYLLIQLRPEVNQELFVKAWFIPDDTIQDPWERFKPLTVDEQRPEIPFVLEKLPQLLSNLLQQCFEEYLQGQPTELTIEIFLPRDHLSDEVEKWSYQDSEGFDITIGTEHRVVVRSYDRLKKIRTQQGSYWRKNWENVQLIWKDIPCIEQITTVDQACFDLNHLRKLLVEKIVLKVCCNLSNSERNGLLSAIHSAGTPIVIWSRCQVENLKNPQHFDTLLAKPLQELSARVREQRLAANDEMHLGNHLVLLWDDPNRVPPNSALEFSAL
jgi:vWA-MoxR associated protein C-terminal domain/Effector-associated domain 10/vWA-MoxR associated protein middle region (VMAP-M) 1